MVTLLGTESVLHSDKPVTSSILNTNGWDKLHIPTEFVLLLLAAFPLGGAERGQIPRALHCVRFGSCRGENRRRLHREEDDNGSEIVHAFSIRKQAGSFSLWTTAESSICLEEIYSLSLLYRDW